jgi:hypothetical protein
MREPWGHPLGRRHDGKLASPATRQRGRLARLALNIENAEDGRRVPRQTDGSSCIPCHQDRPIGELGSQDRVEETGSIVRRRFRGAVGDFGARQQRHRVAHRQAEVTVSRPEEVTGIAAPGRQRRGAAQCQHGCGEPTRKLLCCHGLRSMNCFAAHRRIPDQRGRPAWTL